MSNIGSFGGDVNRPIQNRLSPPQLAKEEPRTTTDNNIVSRLPVEKDQFVTRDIGNRAVVNSALPPKTEKNSNVDNAWSTFAVKAETTNANAVLPPVLNAKPGAPINKLTKPPEGEEPVVIAELTRHIIGGPDTSRVLGIMDGLVYL